ncbi:winged helix-turn-helix domain-containing protein [Aliikangiella coralliicola]|uniref:OmpR/PhoB-type domain-containing protein n=1 Tax=Aliikangiella coralliicola TaxID=2592383 RepID=A0A545U6G7_9GAMM|nr:winged helix-turn-helix domain-containing protein [Aliikangiella coralliicola]TQV85071.1 hypothetical protein FLL46_22035 [Aliikangiella coralliicola]
MDIYQFSLFKFDSTTLTLTQNGHVIELRPKSKLLLKVLLENSSQIVDKNQLLASVWSESVVGENVIYDAIKELRQALGDSPRHSLFIQTLPKKGYQWIYPYDTYQPETIINRVTMNKLKRHLIKIFAFAGIFIIGLMMVSYWLKVEPVKASKNLTGLTNDNLLSEIADSSGSGNATSNQSMANNSNRKPMIAILPFVNQTSHIDASWITLGLMDILENNVAYQDSFITYPSKGILSLLSQQSIKPNTLLDEFQLEKLAQTTSADYVVSVTVSGESNDYGAHASIYIAKDKLSVSRQIEDSSLGNLINKLNFQLTDRFIHGALTFEHHPAAMQDDFMVRIFAEGNEALLSRQHYLAKHYFEIVLQHHPEFLEAKFKLAKTEVELGDLNRAKNLLEAIIDSQNNTAERLRVDELLAAHSANLLGKIHYYQGHYDKSDSLFNYAQAIFEKHKNDKWLAWTYILKSRIAGFNRNPMLAIQHLNTALSLYQKIEHLRGQGWTLQFLAERSFEINQLEQAKLYLEHSLAVRNRAGNQLGVAATLVKMGAYSAIDDKQKALKLYLQALEIYQLVGDKNAEKVGLSVLANFWIREKNETKAAHFVDKLFENAKALQNEKVTLDAQNVKINFLLMKNQVSEAKALLKEMISTSDRLGYLALNKIFVKRLESVERLTKADSE